MQSYSFDMSVCEIRGYNDKIRNYKASKDLLANKLQISRFEKCSTTFPFWNEGPLAIKIDWKYDYNNMN